MERLNVLLGALLTRKALIAAAIGLGVLAVTAGSWWHYRPAVAPVVIEEPDEPNDAPIGAPTPPPVASPAPPAAKPPVRKPTPHPAVKPKPKPIAKPKPAPKRIMRRCDEYGWCWTYRG